MHNMKQQNRSCGRGRGSRRGGAWFLSLGGLLALIWFLFRVVPKPSRVTYPCQRVSAPLASGFVLWVLGLIGSTVVFRRARRFWRHHRWLLASGCLLVAALVGGMTLLVSPEREALAEPRLPDVPLGVARGVNPGRVVWAHDPTATDWLGPGDGHWWEDEHTNQTAVAQMLSAVVRALSGQTNDTEAWDRLIRHCNQVRGKGDVGYSAGEKIAIKTNFVGFHNRWPGIDPVTYNISSRHDYMNTSPQVILALLRHLVNEVGVAQTDITVGDPQGCFPNEYHDPLFAEFPGVRYLDHDGGVPEHPRAATALSAVPFHWSCHPTGVIQDYLPQSYVDAEYFIDLANFKSHSMAGVTLCAKNHYGTLVRVPNESGYFDMHASLALVAPDPAQYRALVDLLGHAHTGGKALLYLVDGLYAGVHPYDDAPIRWDFAPFNDDWTSSLFGSQDPIALDSVCFDFMQEEGDPRAYPQYPGADDYLHEGAQADDPPSGTFYDPDHAGDVARLASLGVHEHWNNSTDKRYSRNLGTGDGIELVQISLPTAVDTSDLALRLALWNYPNPFNPRTIISFELPEQRQVALTVYGLDGRLVTTLARDVLPAGRHEVVWEGDDATGCPVASGVYCYRLQAGSRRELRRMTLLR
ncbi:MAG: DUF362 domain-containing protein [bacterium]